MELCTLGNNIVVCEDGLVVGSLVVVFRIHVEVIEAVVANSVFAVVGLDSMV